MTISCLCFVPDILINHYNAKTDNNIIDMALRNCANS